MLLSLQVIQVIQVSYRSSRFIFRGLRQALKHPDVAAASTRLEDPLSARAHCSSLAWGLLKPSQRHLPIDS